MNRFCPLPENFLLFITYNFHQYLYATMTHFNMSYRENTVKQMTVSPLQTFHERPLSPLYICQEGKVVGEVAILYSSLLVALILKV